MKKIFFCIIGLLISSILSAQTGKVFDNLSMKSEILKMDRKYAIYLPSDYEESERSYPVLYLLHGSGDDQTGWVQFGEVLQIANNAINSGQSTSMIIVMPDANTGRKGYFNSVKGDWQYEDFFFQEFIPYIEKNYRIKAEKQFRAIAGLSMGGGGTFMYALHHPEMFSSACPLSASTGPVSLEETKKYLQRYHNENLSDEEIRNYFQQFSALNLIETLPVEQIKSIRWYIDCGDDDFLFEGNSLIHIAMRKKEIPHEFRIRDGAHNWSYWRQSLPEVLFFISQKFHRYI